MIELSENYKNNIKSMFPALADAWLERIPSIVEKYSKELELSDIQLKGDLTYNVLLFAKSKKYGDVVLKIEIPFEEMTIRESKALELNNGNGACKCYFKNTPDGVILIERLKPGNSLNEEPSLEKRIEVFSKVSKLFNIEVDKECGLPTYKSIFDRSYDLVFGDDKFEDIRQLVSYAKKEYDLLNESSDGKTYLLHSDLYSDNIIMSPDGYKAIDPHGFIGDSVFDTAIIAQKELDKIGYNSENYDYMFNLLSKYCDYSKDEITRAFFVNYVLNICWDREVNIINEASFNNAYDIYDYMSKQKKLVLHD